MKAFNKLNYFNLNVFLSHFAFDFTVLNFASKMLIVKLR